jgi:Zn-dependent protease with chaperone function
MQQNNIQVSPRFKKMAVRAILSIVLFAIVYILLVALAVGLTILCGYGGIALITERPGLYTLIIGIGLIGIGVFILIFLLKFIFSKNITDRSHLTEITEEQEPRLFEFINEIVQEVKTPFPQKIYLSPEVNASVFYDSGFWSMFLPVKKNLQIGMGLVNSISAIEFKAILAHEFGHFSQRSMKVGSYVYNVNKVIYNMLYENTSYQQMVNGWANISGYFSFFVGIVIRIVRGIQWILQKVYSVVNVSYMALSREMEFHADEVAANTAGSNPLITSLLRMELADHAYNTVLGYYNNKIPESVKTSNIYPQQQYVMNFLAKESKLPVENNLPQVDENHLSRYNKSKLVIKDQWASHPATSERVAALKNLNIKTPIEDLRPAIALFSDTQNLQTTLTGQLFSTVAYPAPATINNNEQFVEEYTKKYEESVFNKIYNNYYDHKNTVPFEMDSMEPFNGTGEINRSTIFGSEMVDQVYTSLALENDIQVLNQLKQGKTAVKSFDYNGTKFTPKSSAQLVPQLEAELETIRKTLAENDIDIYRYFLMLAEKQHKTGELKAAYRLLFHIDKEYDRKVVIYARLANETSFIQQVTPFNIIENNFSTLANTEKEFVKDIQDLLRQDVFQPELTEEIKQQFKKYTAQNWVYFEDQKYNNEALDVLFTAINQYQAVLSKTFIRVKKELLNYQAELATHVS